MFLLEKDEEDNWMRIILLLTNPINLFLLTHFYACQSTISFPLFIVDLRIYGYALLIVIYIVERRLNAAECSPKIIDSRFKNKDIRS